MEPESDKNINNKWNQSKPSSKKNKNFKSYVRESIGNTDEIISVKGIDPNEGPIKDYFSRGKNSTNTKENYGSKNDNIDPNPNFNRNKAFDDDDDINIFSEEDPRTRRKKSRDYSSNSRNDILPKNIKKRSSSNKKNLRGRQDNSNDKDNTDKYIASNTDVSKNLDSSNISKINLIKNKYNDPQVDSKSKASRNMVNKGDNQSYTSEKNNYISNARRKNRDNSPALHKPNNYDNDNIEDNNSKNNNGQQINKNNQNMQRKKKSSSNNHVRIKNRNENNNNNNYYNQHPEQNINLSAVDDANYKDYNSSKAPSEAKKYTSTRRKNLKNYIDDEIQEEPFKEHDSLGNEALKNFKGLENDFEANENQDENQTEKDDIMENLEVNLLKHGDEIFDLFVFEISKKETDPPAIDLFEMQNLLDVVGIIKNEFEINCSLKKIKGENPKSFIYEDKYTKENFLDVLDSFLEFRVEDKLLVEAFRKIDPQEDGILNAVKLEEISKKLGLGFSSEEIIDILEYFNMEKYLINKNSGNNYQNYSSTFDFEKFCKLYYQG